MGQRSWLLNPPTGQSNENTAMLLHILGGPWDDTGKEDDQHTGYLQRKTGIIPFHRLPVGCSPSLDLVQKSELGHQELRGKKKTQWIPRF